MALVKTYRHNHNSGKQLTLHWSCEAGTRLRGMAHLILTTPWESGTTCYHQIGYQRNMFCGMNGISCSRADKRGRAYVGNQFLESTLGGSMQSSGLSVPLVSNPGTKVPRGCHLLREVTGEGRCGTVQP